MGGLFEQHVPNWRNKSWSVTAQLIISDSGAARVLLNLGGHGGGGGWSFYLKDTTPTFCYNLFGLSETIIRGPRGSDGRASGPDGVRLRWRRPR
jgi:hypothetical protein